VTFGLGVGIGGAYCFVPTLAVVGHWFKKHRNTAPGMAAAGTEAGTMVVPLVAAAVILFGSIHWPGCGRHRPRRVRRRRQRERLERCLRHYGPRLDRGRLGCVSCQNGGLCG
jgi:nitrate/nitrite transporter NarK